MSSFAVTVIASTADAMSSCLAKNLRALASDQAVSYKNDSGVELARDPKQCLVFADYSWKNGFVGSFERAILNVPCGGKRGSVDASGGVKGGLRT